MKLVIKAMGGFLVAALAVALIFSTTSNVFLPSLSKYIKSNAPTEKNLELISVVAADPDDNRAEPTDLEVYETTDYFYTYVADADGWIVTVKDKTKTQYSPLFKSIYNKPLLSINSAFKDCSFLIQAPAIPNTVIDVSFAFAGCSALSGTIVINASPTQYIDCFKGTVQTIVLSGTGNNLSVLASTSENGNINVA